MKITEKNLNNSIRSSQSARYCYLSNAKAACSTLKYNLWVKEFSEGRIDYLPTTPQLHSRGFWDGSYNSIANDDFFNFSIVRNPFSRIVSCYLDKIKRNNARRDFFCAAFAVNPAEEISFEDFLRHIVENPSEYDDQHWATQTHNLLIGAIKIDFVGHIEYMSEEWALLKERLKIDADIERKSNHATGADQRKEDLLTPVAISLIRAKYAEDFENFGYSIDPAIRYPEKRHLSFPVTDKNAAQFIDAHFMQRDAPEAAMRQYQDLLEVEHTPIVAGKLVTCLLELGDTDEAERQARESVKLHPNHFEPIVSLASVFLQLESIEEATALYQECVDRFPQYHDSWTTLMRLLFQQQQFERIIEFSEIAPKGVLAKHNAVMIMGRAMLKVGKLDKALNCFRRAMRNNPTNALARRGLMEALLKLGHLDEFTQVDGLGIRFNQWKSLYREMTRDNKYAEAMAVIDSAQEHYPDNDWLIAHRKKLSRLP